MSPTQDYKAFFHEEDTSTKQYWGSQAAGCIIIAKDTGRILLGHRSDRCEYEPSVWGTWGGKIDNDEDPKAAVKREVQEETGYDGVTKVSPLYVYTDGDFRYNNYALIVPFEFTPQLNWEHDTSKWIEFGDWPEPMHFGLEALLQHAGQKIKRVVELLKKKKDDFLNEGVVDSDQFKHWFRNSVVKNDDGSPKVVYHGTNQEIRSFSKSRRGGSTQSISSKLAFFFTDSSEVAGEYAAKAGRTVRSDIKAYEKKSKELKKKVDQLERRARLTGEWEAYERAMEEYENFEIETAREDDTLGQNLVPVFLRIENPLVHDFEGIPMQVGMVEKLVTMARKNGNDGVIIKNIVDPSPSSTHYAVFDAKQIKSATGNSGEFNPNDSDITKEAMDTPPAIVQPSTNTNSVVDAKKIADAYIVIATLWGEARGEGEHGMQAVLNVIMNRSKGNFSNARAVSLKPNQFSLWNGVPDPEESALELAEKQRDGKGKDHAQYIQAMKLVDKAMSGTLPDITGGALFYFNPHKVNPKWAKKLEKTKTIGNHDFYKPISKKSTTNKSSDLDARVAASIAAGPKPIKEDSEEFQTQSLGMVDIGTKGYKITSPYGYLSYQYEESSNTFKLNMVRIPEENDQNKGHSKALLKYFFELIHKYHGQLDPGSYTVAGMAHVKHVVDRLAQEYGVKLV